MALKLIFPNEYDTVFTMKPPTSSGSSMATSGRFVVKDALGKDQIKTWCCVKCNWSDQDRPGGNPFFYVLFKIELF